MGHQSVLLQEAIDSLAIKADGIYVDGTFGRGGHSRAILQHLSDSGRLIAIDKDPEAIDYAKQHFSEDPRFQIFQGSFAKLAKYSKEAKVFGQINGILLDLGVSSPQLDNPERGFSFMQQGPLDMRMDLSQRLDAAVFVNEAEADEMAAIFREYGEERFAGRIARAIVAARVQAPIRTTDVLAEIVKQANPKWEKHKHPATRVFQAIRIHVNQELNDLRACLNEALDVLAIGGRLTVISFHSLEDRIVKQFMRDKEYGQRPPAGVPIREIDIHTCFKRVGKAVKASDSEIKTKHQSAQCGLEDRRENSMNAAAKAINQSNFFNGQLLDMRLSKQLCFLLTLLLTVLVSALAIVYTTNEYRLNFIELQNLEQQANQLQLQWGQFLLEQASLATPARVELLASEKLKMRLPTDKEINVLRIQ